ncbi:NADH dehydrogenase, FAD-containing subunit [Rhodococcus sp. RD6.2]|jgi:sulfide:quinone oxidoreductase|uniref:NAD(P)/FAD-dependent oxidoreductase n=1 Tax=Rhodococcus sp. RD6.2 TaxID=260936 RepID=UPI00063B78E1|nr:FAD-dependent oxidoreductase [Rhodococcus sp. RD6.2]CRK54098.1 NADH dehydrogenase, FAD-containing subunit [Rhodococcus sp. RD6.2]
MHSVLILGAGFGGLELAACLSESVPDEVRVTLVDRAEGFVFGFSKIDVLFRGRSVDDVRIPYDSLDLPAVEFRRESVTSIAPATRRVTTDAAEYTPDTLVVALGAEYDCDATPGFVEDGHEFYSLAGVHRLRERLDAFTGGTILLSILSVPFKCPPAPYEGALLLHEELVRRDLRAATRMRLLTPMPSPVPVSAETNTAILGALADRDIEYTPGTGVHTLDPAGHTASTHDGDLAYDLFIGVPHHRVPDVVQASGLTEGGADGWIHVDAATLATPFPGVYAVGDCADAPVPRAGTFAENAARTVAAGIIARLHEQPQRDRYRGQGTCHIEFGGGLVGKVEADFLSGPTPVAPFLGPSLEFAREKSEFAADRTRRWFGS